jgi:hypothetical protein
VSHWFYNSVGFGERALPTPVAELGSLFWDVHDPAKAVAVDLRDARYSKLIFEVVNPAETISALRHALFRRDFQRN